MSSFFNYINIIDCKYSIDYVLSLGKLKDKRKLQFTADSNSDSDEESIEESMDENEESLKVVKT